VFLENRDDLCLGESRLSHRRVPFGLSAGEPTVSNGPTIRGNVRNSR